MICNDDSFEDVDRRMKESIKKLKSMKESIYKMKLKKLDKNYKKIITKDLDMPKNVKPSIQVEIDGETAVITDPDTDLENEINLYLQLEKEKNLSKYSSKLSVVRDKFFGRKIGSVQTNTYGSMSRSSAKLLNKEKNFVSRDKIKKHSLEIMRKEVDIDEHLKTLDDLYKDLKTNPDTGLTDNEVKARLERNGENKLPMYGERSELAIFFEYVFMGFSTLLWLGAFMSFFAYYLETKENTETPTDNLWLGFFLILTCLITGIFSYFQEQRSCKMIESFKQMIPSKATVLRSGKVQEISATNLVKGDIILLKMGEKVPADVRLIQNQDMRVEKSNFTGEIEPVLCSVEATDSFALESRNLLFSSTNIVSGYGKGLVILTGPQTVMGKIASLTQILSKKQTPIEADIKHFMHNISIWALLLGIFCFILAITAGYKWINASVFVIGMIVANVPEGLLPTLTVCLTLTAKRLAKKNCLVKRLHTVETLGSVRTICSDKTGTLTKNKMIVSRLYFKSKNYEVIGGSHLAEKHVSSDPEYNTFLRAACLCSQSEYEPNQEAFPLIDRKASGDATDIGILYFVQFQVKNVTDVRNTFPKVAEIPFNSMNKFTITVHSSPARFYFVLMKGAPEIILDRCKTIMKDKDEKIMDIETRYNLEETIKCLAKSGQRIIGFAEMFLNENQFPVNYCFTTNPTNFPTKDYRFIGFITLIDPPRSEVPEAIVACRKAGIRVIMVTGDHPLTAKCIATKVNILSEDAPDSLVITGTELRKMSDDELREILKENEELVFARTLPKEKMRIVEQCQNLNEIVAVTGDGVNDAPALKKADIGIAMGITGSDVSKQTADMVLLDDNFSTILLGVEQGRLIYDNLKKSTAYVLASNIPEIVPFLLYIFIGIPLPVSAVTILCIDLGTDMWPAVSLAYEKPESNIMLRKPRNPKKEHLLSRKLLIYTYLHIGVLETLAGLMTYFHVMADAGWFPQDLVYVRDHWESRDVILEDSVGDDWDYESRSELELECQTAYFIAIVVAQWADLLICKSRFTPLYEQKMDNWVLNFGLLFETLVACIVTYSPTLNTILKTRPVHWKYWLTPLPIALFIIIYDEIRKLVTKMYPNSIVAKGMAY